MAVACLNDNIQRLKVTVRQIAAGHGPGLRSMADLRAVITPKAAAVTN